MSPLRWWLVLRELDECERFSGMQVEAETSQQAVEILTSDFPDHMLGRPFYVVPQDEVRKYRAIGKTSIKRSVRVERAKP